MSTLNVLGVQEFVHNWPLSQANAQPYQRDYISNQLVQSARYNMTLYIKDSMVAID